MRNSVKCDTDNRRARERLASDLDALGGELELAYENAGHITPGMRQIRHISLCQRVEIDGQKRDRLAVRCRERGTQRRLVPDREEHVNLARSEFAIILFVPFDIRRLDVIESKVPAFLIAEFGHPLEEGGIERELSRLHADKADTQHLRLQLRARGKRPRDRATAEKRNELTPSH